MLSRGILIHSITGPGCSDTRIASAAFGRRRCGGEAFATAPLTMRHEALSQLLFCHHDRLVLSRGQAVVAALQRPIVAAPPAALEPSAVVVRNHSPRYSFGNELMLFATARMNLAFRMILDISPLSLKVPLTTPSMKSFSPFTTGLKSA
jgi:hypothetical protein